MKPHSFPDRSLSPAHGPLQNESPRGQWNGKEVSLLKTQESELKGEPVLLAQRPRIPGSADKQNSSWETFQGKGHPYQRLGPCSQGGQQQFPEPPQPNKILCDHTPEVREPP